MRSPRPTSSGWRRKAFSFAGPSALPPPARQAGACLLTGQSAHSCGQLGLANRDFFLQHPERHLANFLRSHGYRTALCGFQHLTLDSRTLGYGLDRRSRPVRIRGYGLQDRGCGRAHQPGA